MRFQPRSADFQKAVGEGVEHVLQASMFTHSTLTEGEWVQIAHKGTLHDLKVLSLQPGPAVSIIGEPARQDISKHDHRKTIVPSMSFPQHCGCACTYLAET